MPTGTSTTVQVEFFSPSITEAISLETALASAFERGLDGDRIKTVVRFQDERGLLTRKIKSLSEEQSFTLTPSKPSIWERLTKLFHGNTHLHDRTLSLTKKLIRSALATKSVVSIEEYDHRFRPVRADEVHELIERITRSKGAWYFVYARQDDLCTETPGKAIVSCL